MNFRELIMYLIFHYCCSSYLLCVAKQDYISIFFTPLWSVRTTLRYLDTHNPELQTASKNELEAGLNDIFVG